MKKVLLFLLLIASTMSLHADVWGARDYGLDDDYSAPSKLTILIISIIAEIVGVFLGRIGHNMSENGEDNGMYVGGLLLVIAGLIGGIYSLHG